MHQAAAWRFCSFGPGDLLDELHPSTQRDYLRNYLADLEAAEILREDAYFDRDYLAEFAAFYGMSARGYKNLCKRLSFFKRLPQGLETTLAMAIGGDGEAIDLVDEAFLGFMVQRPIPSAQVGRTVVRWYPDHPTKGAKSPVLRTRRGAPTRGGGARLATTRHGCERVRDRRDLDDAPFARVL